MPSRTPPIVQLAQVPGRPPRVDVAIAAGLFVWAALEGLLATGPGSTPIRLLLALGFAAPLVLRRRWPVPVVLFVAALAVLRGLMGGPDEEGSMPVPTLLVASFSAALYARPRWLAFAALPMPLIAVSLGGYGEIEHGPGAFISAVAWLGGWLVRRRAEQLARERAAAPELARDAVAAERARMARELHDVVAHAITAVSVQAGAAEQQLDVDVGKARSHLEAVGRTAREALVELRRLVGVLREEGGDAGPRRGLAELDLLLDEMRAAGLEVELDEEGGRSSVPAGVDLAAYRIVQESLTNVRRHAGVTRARVRLRYGDDRLDLEVANEPGASAAATAAGGHGLIGMEERARLYGGGLHAGPTPDGGFAVTGELPYESRPATTSPSLPHVRAGDVSKAEAAGEPLLELARVPRGLPRVDLLLAAGVLVWALLEALLVAGAGPVAVRILVAVAMAAALLRRRRFPLPALAAVCVLSAAPGLVFDGREEGSVQMAAMLLATFSAGLYARSRALAATAVPLSVATVALAVIGADLPSPPAVDIAILSGLAVGAWVAGFLIRRRAEQIAQARADGPRLAREAVAAERARMARELHDVVAHSVTVISMQAGAAEELLDRDADQARRHLEAVGRAAHEALVELRRLVGVLREDEPTYQPQPGLDRLDELLGEARAAGLEVEVREEGSRSTVPAGLDLAAYRIVQESLTNVRRHAGSAPTRVRIGYGEDSLRLEVENDPARRNGAAVVGTGHGLIGMRERARLYGGSLEAGPTEDGGFRVRANLPLEPPP